MNKASTEDELYIRLKYNVETYENHHYVYFRYSQELYSFLENAGFAVGKYANYDENPCIGIFIDDIKFHPEFYNRLINQLLEFDRGELDRTSTPTEKTRQERIAEVQLLVRLKHPNYKIDPQGFVESLPDEAIRSLFENNFPDAEHHPLEDQKGIIQKWLTFNPASVRILYVALINYYLDESPFE